MVNHSVITVSNFRFRDRSPEASYSFDETGAAVGLMHFRGILEIVQSGPVLAWSQRGLEALQPCRRRENHFLMSQDQSSWCRVAIALTNSQGQRLRETGTSPEQLEGEVHAAAEGLERMLATERED